MSGGEFSPGPWRWQDNRDGKGYLIDAAGEPFPSRVIEGLSPQNARLIAAAPEMYELIKSGMAGIRHMAFQYAEAGGMHGPEMREYNEECEAIRALLARIDGEEKPGA
mgnify:CR=1 FL=1